MDDIFFNEFRPPDNSMIEFVLNSSVALRTISGKDFLSEDDRTILQHSSHTMKVMLAMAVGGHFLFTSEAKHADALAELAGYLYDCLMLSGVDGFGDIDIQPLQDFHQYREEGPNPDDLPFDTDGVNE